MPFFGWFDCPHCIQDFDLIGWPPPNLPKNAKVFIVCPGCGNTVQFFAVEIDQIKNGFPVDLRAESFTVGPAAPLPLNFLRNMNLRIDVIRKQTLVGGCMERSRTMEIPKEDLT
jgi:hypothetical protein